MNHTSLLWQLLIGSGVIALTVAVHAEMLGLLTHRFAGLVTFFRKHLYREHGLYGGAHSPHRVNLTQRLAEWPQSRWQ
jgi:hypothetical protein